MPDISMCANTACPLRGKCYRWRAVPSEFRQAYAGFAPTKCDDGADRCDHFVPLERGDLVRVVRMRGRKLVLTTDVFRMPA